MSLYSALFAGVSGLGAQSNAMATVADNINNVNTVGYKGSRAGFSSMVTGGRDGGYSAGGVDMVARSLISREMPMIDGTANTNMAVGGNGFFVVRPQPGSTDVAFTRAGSFVVDNDGNLKNLAGFYLQGWPLDRNGDFTDTGSLDALDTVNVTGLGDMAEATTRIQAQLNLDGRTAIHAGPPAYAAGSMAAGTVAPQFGKPFDVTDAQGNTHQLSLGFVKTGANQWQAELYARPASDVTQADGLLASGTVSFDAMGQIDMAASTAALFAGVQPAWTNGAGSSPITLEPTAAGFAWTQLGDTATLGRTDIDGGLLGKVTDVGVSETGVVSVSFANGKIRDIYQLPLATFPNADGLARLPGDAFAISQDSGAAIFGAATTNGSGKVLGNKLESSTTDLAREFTDMIVYQRAYSASSKIITTVDEMLQDLNNLKR